MRLEAKIHQYEKIRLRHPKMNMPSINDVGVATIFDALFPMQPPQLREWLLNNKVVHSVKGNRTLAQLLSKHALKNRKYAERMRRYRFDESAKPRPEVLLQGGKYYLSELKTEAQFKQETAWLRHCLGGSSIRVYLL
jgi:hypothetical protein